MADNDDPLADARPANPPRYTKAYSLMQVEAVGEAGMLKSHGLQDESGTLEAECSRLRAESNERLQKILQLQHTVDHLNHLMKNGGYLRSDTLASRDGPKPEHDNLKSKLEEISIERNQLHREVQKLKDANNKLNEKLSDEEVTQIQFNATQEELADVKEALQLLQQTSLRAKKEAAVEHQALQSRLAAAQEEIVRLREEMDEEKKQKATLQAQLLRLLKPASHEAGGAHRSEDTEWRAVMADQLESSGDKVRRLEAALADLSGALAAERERVVQLSAEMSMAVIKGEALQEDADAARRDKELAEARRDEALQHGARMQRLADDALAETGAVSDQLYALQDLLAIKEGRAEEAGALRLGAPRDRAAQDHQRALMDAAAEELAQLKAALARSLADRPAAEEAADEAERLRHELARVSQEAAVALAREQARCGDAVGELERELMLERSRAARMEAIANDALAETGALSEQVYALEEELRLKDAKLSVAELELMESSHGPPFDAGPRAAGLPGPRMAGPATGSGRWGGGGDDRAGDSDLLVAMLALVGQLPLSDSWRRGGAAAAAGGDVDGAGGGNGREGGEASGDFLALAGREGKAWRRTASFRAHLARSRASSSPGRGPPARAEEGAAVGRASAAGGGKLALPAWGTSEPGAGGPGRPGGPGTVPAGPGGERGSGLGGHVSLDFVQRGLVQLLGSAQAFLRRRRTIRLRGALRRLRRRAERKGHLRRVLLVVTGYGERRRLRGSLAHLRARLDSLRAGWRRQAETHRRATAKLLRVLRRLLRRCVESWRGQATQSSLCLRQVYAGWRRSVYRAGRDAVRHWVVMSVLRRAALRRVGLLWTRSRSVKTRWHWAAWRGLLRRGCAPSAEALRAVVELSRRAQVGPARRVWELDLALGWSPDFRRFWNVLRRSCESTRRRLVAWSMLTAEMGVYRRLGVRFLLLRVSASLKRHAFGGWNRATFGGGGGSGL